MREKPRESLFFSRRHRVFLSFYMYIVSKRLLAEQVVTSMYGNNDN